MICFGLRNIFNCVLFHLTAGLLYNDFDKRFFKEEMNAQFIIKLASTKRNVFEEILILDEIGLIGSLGGSLGLFVGFSFFGYAIPILEAAFNKVADFFSLRINLIEE